MSFDRVVGVYVTQWLLAHSRDSSSRLIAPVHRYLDYRVLLDGHSLWLMVMLALVAAINGGVLVSVFFVSSLFCSLTPKVSW